MSPDLEKSFRQFAAILPVVSAIGIGLGVIYDWGYFGQFDIRFFFLIGLADHTLSAVLWMLGTFFLVALSSVTNLIDDVELGIDHKDRFYVYAKILGSSWVRGISFICVILSYIVSLVWSLQWSYVVAISFAVAGGSHYLYLRYVRHTKGQVSGMPDLSVLVVALGFSAYFAGVSNFHFDFHKEPQTIVVLREKRFSRVVLLRAVSDGVIIYKPAQQAFEFVRSANIERVRIRHNKPARP